MSIRRIVSVMAGGLLLASCSASGSVSIGQKVVPKADVEAQASKQLAAQNPARTVPTIKCPDDLDAKVGATMQCILTVRGDPTRYPVEIKVESLENGEVQFNVHVGATPLP